MDWAKWILPVEESLPHAAMAWHPLAHLFRAGLNQTPCASASGGKKHGD